MLPKIIIMYSELFDTQPTMDELVALVKQLPLRHSAYILCYINLVVRYGMQEQGMKTFGKTQEAMVAAHIDDEIFELLRSRLGMTRCDERPIFVPHTVLSLLRLVLAHSDPAPMPDLEDDERVRYAVGRACLMMNNLLFTEHELRALQSGNDDSKRLELMVQTMSGFELANAQKPEHLMPRLHIMFRTLLRDKRVKARFALECEGFDFEEEFLRLTGITLERWLFILFGMFAYFLDGSNILQLKTDQLLLNPATFRGNSGITEDELSAVLKTIGIPSGDLNSLLLKETSTDPRYDFVSFRSKPLLMLEANKLIPVDMCFLSEKCHAGVQWTLHDALTSRKMRQTLFNAWGVLFEEYVHWLFQGMLVTVPFRYVRSPKWKGTIEEAVDGLCVRGTIFMPMEFKGGFLARDARYSGDSNIFIADLDKKFGEGADQLADKIGAAFCLDAKLRKQIDDVLVDHIRIVLPVLVLQDHITRVPLLNWYLNKKFRSRLANYQLRNDIVVQPLTVLNITELEGIIHSAEASGFDFIHALHERTVHDPDALSDLPDILRLYRNYGKRGSPRLQRALDTVQKDLSAYLFPGQSIV